MRRNQVTMGLERFGDQTPEGSQRQHISVYADANNVWEAIAAAFVRLTEEIQRDQPLPSFGRVEGHTRNVLFDPAQPGKGKTQAEREAQAQAWAERNKEEAMRYRKPGFCPELLAYAAFAEGKLTVGTPLFVCNQWLGKPLRYRYSGFQKGNYRHHATALDFADVVDALLYAPGRFSVEGVEEDYSPGELRLLNEMKEKLQTE